MSREDLEAQIAQALSQAAAQGVSPDDMTTVLENAQTKVDQIRILNQDAGTEAHPGP